MAQDIAGRFDVVGESEADSRGRVALDELAHVLGGATRFAQTMTG